MVPTSATESWKQVDADTWQFELRKGVKFHNGEAWNAQAAIPSLEYQSVPANNSYSFPYTSGFKPSAVGEYSVQIDCLAACPIFPNTAIFTFMQAPEYLKANPKEEDRVRQAVGFGPYKLVKWDSGVSITHEAYADYVPAGTHYELQKPLIKNVRWLWRAEQTVMTAMIQQGEADMAWDVGVDQAKALPKERVRSGSSAETLAFTVNTVWHPELKKLKVRQAIVAAINCKEMIDALYGGLTQCRGNIIWPGVIGATERNTAPYEYNPTRAKQLLAEANYDPKNVIKITGRPARIPKLLEVYEAMQSYLKQVGMNVEINVVEAGVRTALTNCGIGKAVSEVVGARGGDPAKDVGTLVDMEAAVKKGGATCPTGDLIENEPSNETLDFGRQANFYMSCLFPRSLICDPSPGGIQSQIAPALAASGAERQRLLSIMADKMHDDVLFIGGFDLPVLYGVNPKLNFKPRFDGRVRAQTMWFSP
jgi:ABC-type transport system substrate-binding protein